MGLVRPVIRPLVRPLIRPALGAAVSPYPAAALYADYAGNRYWTGANPRSFPDLHDFVRASVDYGVDGYDRLKGVTSGQPLLLPNKGLAVQGARTNYARYSNDFIEWFVQNGVELASREGGDPFGGASHYRIVYDGTANGRIRIATASRTWTPSGTVCGSIYIRKISGTTTSLTLGFVSGALNNNEASVSSVGSEWTRVNVTATAKASGQSTGAAFLDLDCDDVAVVEVAFAQIEEAAAPTPYVPTDGAAVSVVATQASIVGAFASGDAVSLIESDDTESTSTWGVVSSAGEWDLTASFDSWTGAGFIREIRIG